MQPAPQPLRGPGILPAVYNEKALGNYQGAYNESVRRLQRLGLRTDHRGLARSLFWTIRLSMAIESYDFAQIVPGLQYTAVGFLDPIREANQFGIIIFAAIRNAGEPMSSRPEKVAGLPTSITVDGHSFPIVVRRVREIYHHFPSHPVGGTAGCWAKSGGHSKATGPGILTAKHVVGAVKGVSIQLSCGCSSTVSAVGPDGIDAALVTGSCTQNLPSIRPVKLIAPWTDVYFKGASSGICRTQVTAVSETMGILNEESLPSRVFLAHPGKRGDSGALVRESNSGDAIGIYMGALSNSAQQLGGFCQHAYQVTQLMELELFEYE